MSGARPIKAIVIAAGMGRRLSPYTDQMPKTLVPVAGKPMLGWQIAAFRAHGIEELVVIRGCKGEVFDARRGELEAEVRLRLVDNPEFLTNNIMLSLFHATHELDGPVLVTYGDIVFTPEVVGALMAAEGDVCLVIDRDFADIYEGRTEHPLSEAEVSDLTSDGHVHRVGKRALPVAEAWGEFIGLLKLSARGAAWFVEAWRELEERYRGRAEEPFERAAQFRNAYLTDLLQHLINAGRPVTPVAIHGCWREIDTVQDFERAQALLGCAQEAWK